MKRVLSSMIAIVVLTLGLHAQTTPDGAELTRLLKEFLAGASRNDAATHERFWADDLIYTGSTGRRVGKADIMRDVRAAPAPKPDDPKTTYTAEEIRIQQYGDTAIVAFRLVGTTEKDGKTEAANFLNTGTFLKRDGKWQVVSWQATRLPRPEDESKKEVAAVSQESPPIRNFLRVNKEFCTGGQPRLEHLAKLKEEGVKAIINLRQPSEHRAEEERAEAERLGLRYFNIPFAFAAPKDEQATEFLKLTDDPANRPAFIHCTAAIRVGAFWMIRRVLRDNWTIEEAEKEAEKVGLRESPHLNEFARAYIEKHGKK